MGKKSKTGKARLDKFYKLAKETGFRSRAAFKLLQLNRKFQFLEKSRVCIDLCAAPGGWLQAASQNMPISKVIVGIDLAPIKPVPGCSTYQEDITSEKCRQLLRKELATWKADVVLHDGAPNVGTNWLHDAYIQVELTLYALKLATEFLRKGGWFVTKVFRSKDYHALLWVLNQMFRKVHSTKPQASRTESAEIFVVCQGFKAPDRIDPKFLDPKHVFKELADSLKKPTDIFKQKDKAKAEGYADNDYTLHHKLPASDFFKSQNAVEKLVDIHEVVLDDPEIAEHELTTDEIKECCKDIKVLGKRELRLILGWRKKLKKLLEEERKKKNQEQQTEEKMDTESDDSDKEVEEELKNLQEEQRKDLKRKKKKVMKEKRKLRDKMSLNMVIPGDHIEQEELDLFSSKKMEMMQENPEALGSDDEMIEFGVEKQKQELEDGYDSDHLQQFDTSVRHKLNVPDDDKCTMWFSKKAFADLSSDEDDEEDIKAMKKRANLERRKEIEKQKRKQGLDDDDELSWEEDNSEDDDDTTKKSHSNPGDEAAAQRLGQDSDSDSDSGNESVEFDPVKELKSQDAGPKQLEPVDLAIGEELMKSKKRRREIIESGYNRYTFGEEELPQWFSIDEAKHNKITLPVNYEQINAYNALQVDARPIKKIAEAKARKKKKLEKRLDRARKKAEAVGEVEGLTEAEKNRQMKDIYKRAGLLRKPKREVTYVVAKRGTAGKKAVRPAGVKGFYKQVDPRMKKDQGKDRGKDKGQGKKGKKGQKGQKKKGKKKH